VVDHDDVVSRAEARVNLILWGNPSDSFSARELLFVVDLPALIAEVKRLRTALEESSSEVETLKRFASYGG